MRRLIKLFLPAALLSLVVFWVLSAPTTISDEVLQEVSKAGDPVLGEAIFYAGGCASCHSAKAAQGDEKLLLGGDHKLVTPVGVFNVPNISPHEEYGIGKWSIVDFANAMLLGTSPKGSHYYPAFPYTSYAKMKTEDIRNLWSYLQTLEPVATQNEPHELSFPFNISRGIGLWKQLFLDSAFVVNVGEDEQMLRGRYLVEGLGHCAECHTPRLAFGYGGVNKNKWLAGALSPEGKGVIPNITPHETGIASWSEGDIVYYLESGFTPDYDSVGGSMFDVQQNMAKLPKQDLEAIAQYLKSIPAVSSN
jgi:mono/diheme cytochrome c family protein